MGIELQAGERLAGSALELGRRAAGQAEVMLEAAARPATDLLQAGERVAAGIKGRIPVTMPHVIRSVPNPVVRPSGQLAGKLYGQLRAGAKEELQALARLSPAQQAQFKAIAALLRGRPDARLALRQLLLDGRLTRASAYADNGDLLTQLHQVSGQRLAERLDRRAYVAEVLQELKDFCTLDKGPKGTCAATTARGMLIQFDPAEYMRIQRGLISPRGVAPLREPSGAISSDPKRMLRRKPDWYFDDVPNGPGRTIAARVQDPAAMQYAYDVHGPRYFYDNARDTQVLRSNVGKSLDSGLQNSELRHLLMGYFPGSRWTVVELPARGRDEAAIRLLDRVGELASLQRPIPVAVYYPDGPLGPGEAHQIGVIKVTPERVTYFNPHGRLESMPRQAFQQILIDGLLPRKAY